jgi:hypothetical protein
VSLERHGSLRFLRASQLIKNERELVTAPLFPGTIFETGSLLAAVDTATRQGFRPNKNMNGIVPGACVYGASPESFIEMREQPEQLFIFPLLRHKVACEVVKKMTKYCKALQTFGFGVRRGKSRYQTSRMKYGFD